MLHYCILYSISYDTILCASLCFTPQAAREALSRMGCEGPVVGARCAADFGMGQMGTA